MARGHKFWGGNGRGHKMLNSFYNRGHKLVNSFVKSDVGQALKQNFMDRLNNVETLATDKLLTRSDELMDRAENNLKRKLDDL